MEMFDKQFEKELDLVSLALESEEGEKKIIKYLNPLVISVANDFIEEYESKKGLRLDKNKKNNVPKAGWTYLHFALKKYNEKIKNEQEEIHSFSEYFTWFIKQGVLEYLQSEFN